jgi:hypothetical protein
MLRTILVTVIVLCSADILLADGKYSTAGARVMVEMWSAFSRI